MDWPRLKVSYTNSGWDETFRPLNTKLRTELTWWIEHLKFCNGRTFSRLNPQIIIQTDVYLILWGAVCNGDQMSGQWSEKERTIHMNILELSAINWFFFLRQREESESHTLSGRQQGSLVLPFENGRNKERTYDQIKQRDLTLLFKSQYIYHSRISAFNTECSSRQGIKEETRLFRVGSSSQSFSSSFSTTRLTDNRSILFPSMSSTISIHSLASRSI